MKDVPSVKIFYNTSNKARHPLSGSVRIGGVVMNYGYKKQGDVFFVAEGDILARPDLFLAFPCKQPFAVKDGKLVDPCSPKEEKAPAEKENIVKKAAPKKRAYKRKAKEVEVKDSE